MKRSYGSYVNEKTSLPFLSFHLLFFRGLFEQWSLPYTYIYIHIYIYIYSCREQYCLFEFPSLAVILKHNRRFINFIIFLMADPSPHFVPALMTWEFKRESLCNPNTNSFLLSRTLFPFSLSSPFPLPQTPHTFSSIKFLHNGTAKSQSFSYSKGKEVISDPPAARDVGEEVVYSESDHSDEEETEHDSDSECTPLIDPWYDVHPHFPQIPGDYAPPPSGCVWLALCRRNTNISWAPLASSIPDLVIRQGISLPVPIHFEFKSGTALGWKEWVDNDLSDIGFMGLLQRVDVLKAIVSSHCLSNFRDLFNLRHLVRRWCTTTHTFFFSCGEVTMTLEDVAN